MLGRSLAIAAAGGLLASGLAALPASASVVARAGSEPAPHQGAAARQAMLQARARWLREHGTSQQRAVAAAALRGALARATGPANGMLTGVVRGIDGRPVAGACVSATGPSGTVLGRSRSNGRYILPGLRSGAYAVHIGDCARRSQPARRRAATCGRSSRPQSRSAAARQRTCPLSRQCQRAASRRWPCVPARRQARPARAPSLAGSAARATASAGCA